MKTFNRVVDAVGDKTGFFKTKLGLLIQKAGTNPTTLTDEEQEKLIDHIVSVNENPYIEIEILKKLIPLAAAEITRRDDKNPGELVIAAMQNCYPELAPDLIAAGAAQEMAIGERVANQIKKKEGNHKEITPVEKKVFEHAKEVCKGKNSPKGVKIDNVVEIDKWTPLMDVAAQIVIARNNEGKEIAVDYAGIARDLVANGAKIEKVTMKVSTDSKGLHEEITKNMLDILKDNIEFQKTDEAKALAKDDFDKMKDALREGQAILKAQIITDRVNRAAKIGGYKVLLDDAVHMFKKAVGMGVEETERDRLREKQKAIGRALRDSGSLSSSVENVFSGNFGSKKEKGRSV